MRIRITKAIGSKVDGVPMGPYQLGREYDVDDERGRLFVGSAMAEEVIPVVEEAQPVEVVAEAVAEAVTDTTTTDTDADSEATSRRRRR